MQEPDRDVINFQILQRTRPLRLRAGWSRRTTSSGSKSSSSAGVSSPRIWASRAATAARPIASIGWRTVVSGGSTDDMNAESS